MSGTAGVRLSSSVLLLRQCGSEIQVLMQKRADRMTFAAQWVFPGGTVNAADGDPAADLQAALQRAALRETLEEAGVDLGSCGPPRTGLVPWSRWITPSGRPRRYDAWFFAAALPDGACVEGDGTEAIASEWVAPERALEARERGRMAMMPPTAVMLMDLAWTSRRHGSVAALLDAERGREIVPILPRLVERPEGVFTVYPWDVEYDALPGEGIPLARVPGHLGRLPSRLPAPRVQP
jgi:8-oxo-dGTP pyrophosphatase MutT (NUDIX family)